MDAVYRRAGVKKLGVPDRAGLGGEWRISKDEMKINPIPFPDGEFGLIYADPPWRYQNLKSKARLIENNYPTMETEDICAMNIPSSPNCILFLWTTSPHLTAAIKVIKAWGFTYKTSAVWDKKVIGMGYYFRLQHELLLVAIKGEPGTPDPRSRRSSVLQCKRGKHSRKPDHFYEIIERMYPDARKLELFARQTRPGWSSWGNEVEGKQGVLNFR